MLYNFIAATSLIDDLLLGLAKKRKFNLHINTFKFQSNSTRHNYIHGLMLTILIVLSITFGFLPIDRSWRVEIIIKSTFAIILVVNMASVWFLRLETVMWRYIANDFLFRGYICSYMMIFYAGQDPISDELTTQFILCVAVFRSFRLLWTNVNIAALAQISAGIIREIARSRLPEEPVWARDAFCVFYSELVIMVFLRLTARAIAIRQTVRKMEKDNYWRFIRYGFRI